MKRIFIPTQSGSDWKRLLSKPALHWKVGKSAMTLAASWEAAHPSLPPEVESSVAALGVRRNYIAAFPEWEVALPGGATASHTDLLVFAKMASGLAVIAVEGKVDEALGPTLGEKRHEASAGVQERITFLHEVLGLKAPAPDSLRYQLLHRTASAVLVARELGAALAVMLVHSFSPESRWRADYEDFAKHLGANASTDRVELVPGVSGPQLAIGWVQGSSEFLSAVLPPAR